MTMMTTRSPMTQQQLLDFARKRIDMKMRYYLRGGSIRENDADDLTQDILVTIMEKLKEFDIKRQTCKKTFINAIIKNAFKYHFLKYRWVKHQEPEDIDELPEEDVPTTQRNGRIAETDLMALRMDLDAFRDTCLTPKQQQVFDLLGEHTKTQIASILGLSQARVCQLCESISLAASETDLGDYF